MKAKSQICKAAADLLSKAAGIPEDFEDDTGMIIEIVADVKNAETGVDTLLRHLKGLGEKNE